MASVNTEVPQDLASLSAEDVRALYYQVCDDYASAKADQQRVVYFMRENGIPIGDQPEPAAPAPDAEAQVATAPGAPLTDAAAIFDAAGNPVTPEA